MAVRIKLDCYPIANEIDIYIEEQYREVWSRKRSFVIESFCDE